MFDIIPSAYAWHKRAGEFIKNNDDFGHLISESFGIPPGNPLIDNYNVFDLTTTHYYTRDIFLNGFDKDIGPALAFIS